MSTTKENVKKNKNEHDHSSDQKQFSFDKSFQEKIMQAMLIDQKWAVQFTEVLDVDYFQFAYLKLISNDYISYYQKYKEFPSRELLVTILREDLKNNVDSLLKDQIKEFFFRIESNKDLSDLPYVKEKALDFCKRAKLQQALMQSIDFINTEEYDKVIDVVKKALSAGSEHNVGIELLEDIDARYSETYRKTIPTGIPELDSRKILNGGLGTGELGFVVANSGVGKSHILVHFGAAAIKAKKNVVYYSFELNERMIGIRFDSHLVGINSLDCFDRKDQIKHYYNNHKEDLGKLVIKYYPTGQASCQSLRSHLEKLSMKGFIPDLILVDYAGIMRSADKNDLLRLELKKVAEELREFADEVQCAVWSACQANKEGATADFIDMTNIAESYGVAHVADFVMGLSRQSAQKSTGFGNIFVAKNRAGVDGIKYHVHLDTSQSRLKVLTDQEASEAIKNIDEDGMNFVRAKFKETLGKK
jgi:replicative DNA helicase